MEVKRLLKPFLISMTHVLTEWLCLTLQSFAKRLLVVVNRSMDDKTSRFSVVSNGIKCFLSAAELLCIQNMWGRTGDFTSESCSLKHFIHRESLWQRENFSSSLYAFCHPPEYWWAYRVVHSGDGEKNLEPRMQWMRNKCSMFFPKLERV